MADQSAIEWCDSTFNPWEGCTKVSPGCDHCYAEHRNARFAGGASVNWGPGAPRRRTSEANWRKPLQWERAHEAFAAEHGRRRRVFCASLADVFDNEVPAEWRADLLMLIRATPHLDWLLLTKRVGNAARLLAEACDLLRADGRLDGLDWLNDWVCGSAPANVWLGATVVNQAEADRDIPKLLATPARVRFLSIEPMLGPISFEGLFENSGDMRDGTNALEVLDWVICGGESGPHARPMHTEWASSLRDQCAAAGIPFLFKQWGEWLPINQMNEEFTDRLYKPNRVAKLHEDQDALNDCYGRRCTVPQGVHQADGTLLHINSPMAFRQGLGSMQIFNVGKKAAGRLLDGVEHNGFPAAVDA